MNKKLAPYVSLVDFLSKALGEYYEIVLHDLSDPEHSIVAIANGHLSGRAQGDPATDFALQALQRGLEKGDKYIVNYRAKNMNGHLFRSSSYYIRDDKGKLLGVLCINLNVSPFISLREQLTKHIIGNEFILEDKKRHSTNSDGMANVFDNFQGSIEDVIRTMINNALAKYSVSPDRLSVEERINVVEELNDSGLFLLKGGLASLAERLSVSEPTVYRYLSKVKRKS